MQNSSDSADVVLLNLVRDSIVEHDLDSAKLRVGRVHLAPKQLVQG